MRLWHTQSAARSRITRSPASQHRSLDPANLDPANRLTTLDKPTISGTASKPSRSMIVPARAVNIWGFITSLDFVTCTQVFTACQTLHYGSLSLPGPPMCSCQHTTKSRDAGSDYHEWFDFQCGPKPDKQMQVVSRSDPRNVAA